MSDFNNLCLFGKTGLWFFIISMMVIGISFGAVIQGTVFDQQTGAVIPYATVRVEGTGKSALSNAEGKYRIKLDTGQYVVRFSHIAYYSDSVVIAGDKNLSNIDIRLRPAVQLLKGMKVYTRAYDPAQRIILEAIAHKDSLLNRLRSYSFESYTKMVIRDRKKPDSINILAITETQSISNWEKPHKQKETIIARRESANLEGAEVLVAFGGELLDFNRNRLDLGENSMVSPTATDALDYYNYYLIDTVYLDKRAIFRLEVEPKKEAVPLFAGTIDIVDSSFDVAGVDLGFNKAGEIPFLKNTRYSQKCAPFGNDIWMPIEIRLAADINFPFPGLPPLNFDVAAALLNYTFNLDYPDEAFDYAIEVDKNADKVDSSVWATGPSIPLTTQELEGYRRIDSTVKHIPVYKKAMRAVLAAPLVMSFAQDFFHFNRVEGAYLGGAVKPAFFNSKLQLRLKSGWAFGGKYWQHDYTAQYDFMKKRGLRVSFGFHDLITHRPTVISSLNGNPTIPSLFDRADPYEYYLEKGFMAKLESSILPEHRLTLGVTYRDYDQYAVINATNYAFVKTSHDYRINPPITDGKLRSLTYSVTWETRNWMKIKGREETIPAYPYTRFSFNMEMASPDLIKNDFNFRRYQVGFNHQREFLGLGKTSLFLSAGISDKELPPQRYFTVDCSEGILYEALAFKTMGHVNFAGNRMAAGYLEQDFGRRFFLWTGLPPFKSLPLTLSAYGGIFWTEFRNHAFRPGDEYMIEARSPYREIGFAIGGLPLLLKTYFTWQLSNYQSNKFSFVVGMGF
ncbi:hypothetical protein TRIP_C10012 [Candidatus Zixiibacteriota bacterium]|nr:hypothetical protein TRIP_C10012 [candidate division Zixibacteria bacterium]